MREIAAIKNSFELFSSIADISQNNFDTWWSEPALFLC